MPARLTVYVDDDLLQRVRRIVPPRGLNRFINETLAEKVEALERERIEAAMREGYLATRRERSELNEDWRAVDTEDWPE